MAENRYDFFKQHAADDDRQITIKISETALDTALYDIEAHMDCYSRALKNVDSDYADDEYATQMIKQALSSEATKKHHE